MILLKTYWKNIIAQSILNYAKNNGVVKGAIDIEELINIKVNFDILFEEDEKGKEPREICEELKSFIKQKPEKEQFEELSEEERIRIIKSVVKGFFKDKVCYFRHNTLVFPSRFFYKKLKNKNSLFEIEKISLISRKNAEYTFGTVVSYLYYWNEFYFVKHLEEGVVLEDEKSTYYIEFELDDDEKKNKEYTTIKIYASNSDNNAEKLYQFIKLILKYKLELLYEKEDYDVFEVKNDFKEKIGEVEFSYLFNKKNDADNFLKNCKNEEFILILKERKSILDERLIYAIEEEFEKDLQKVLKMIDERINLNQNRKDNNHYTFIHLSDIHFSSDTAVEDEFCLLKRDLQKENVKKIDYVVISGDLSIKADKKEFKRAEEFINKIINEYELSPRKIIIVPGNHDYDRKVTQRAYEVVSFSPNNFNPQKDYKIDDGVMLKRNDEIWKCKFDNFSDYIYERIYNKTYPDEWKDCIEDGEFYFVLINTSKKLDQFHNIIEVNRNDLINCNKENKKFKFVVGHHPLNHITNQFESEKFFELLNEFGYMIYFHGHVHNSKLILAKDYYISRAKTVTIGAGLFINYKDSAMLPGVPLRYNIIKIDPSNKRIILKVRERETKAQPWKPSCIFFDENGDRVEEITIEY